MTRKRFDMTPELYLEVGPDRFHTARLGPLRPSELFEAVQTSFEDMRRLVYQDEQFGAKWEDRLTEAVCDWNSTWAEEEGHESGGGWKWLGVGVKAKCDEMGVWAYRLEGEPGVCTVYIDQEAIDSRALDAARAAHEILSEIVTKPGGNRRGSRGVEKG